MHSARGSSLREATHNYFFPPKVITNCCQNKTENHFSDQSLPVCMKLWARMKISNSFDTMVTFKKAASLWPTKLLMNTIYVETRLPARRPPAGQFLQLSAGRLNSCNFAGLWPIKSLQ
jgi:hypothetical protein